jgi:two-component system sensor histidine kinase RpfC
MARLANAKRLMVSLRGRPDSEHEMSFNRLALSVASPSLRVAAQSEAGRIPELIGYCIVSVAIFVQILIDRRSESRGDSSVLVTDLSITSYAIHANGRLRCCLLPILSLDIFGNGFPLRHSLSAHCVAGFGRLLRLVVWFTPYWHDMPILSVGLLCGLVLLPAYAGR